MEKFTVHQGTTMPIMNDDIDTDQLLPKQFLKRLTKRGYGDVLFYEWRYQADGVTPQENFILNEPARQQASILITGDNFGIGSSREHAVWALRDWGFKAIIAGSFGPILYMNCTKNGVLPIELEQSARETLSELPPTAKVTIDLVHQTVKCGALSWKFTINPAWKEKFLKGEDDIDQTMKFADQIAAYEAQMSPYQ